MLNETERHETRRTLKEAAASRDAHAAIQASRTLLASGKSADVMFCSSALTGIADAIEVQCGAKRLKTYVVRSVTVEPIQPALMVEAVLANFILDLRIGGYGSYADELMNPQSELAQFGPDAVLVLLDLEEIAGNLPDLCATGKNAEVHQEIDQCVTRVAQMLTALRRTSAARIVFQGCVVPDLSSLGEIGAANLPFSLSNAVQWLNQRLASLCRTISDCIFFDVDHLAASYGRARWRDARMFLASRLAVSADAFSIYAHGLIRSLQALYRTPRKVLCTDLDNTFWGGILGEDGAEGIVAGSAFPGNSYLEYQRYLKRLSARGILLAVVSKNNETDVREAFQTRAADLALGMDNFVALKIGWDEKSQSIRELAKELSLGLDSFVFVDDSPVECESIRRQLPEVAVVEVPVNEPWKLVEILSRESFFDATVVTDDDLNRVHEYKAQAQRAQLETSAASRDEFLASLGIVCTFESALRAPLARAVQLLAKTNQFNLTTRRHSAAEVEDFAANGQAWVARVRDRFGDAGVVGLVLARYEGDACRIDSFLLSCRVIGRGIETALLSFVAENAKQAGAKRIKRIIGEYIPTKKNAPCASFYTDHGFAQQAAPQVSNSICYEFDLTASTLSSPGWITLEGNKSNEPSTVLAS
ncbi:MAG: HAD-IIIC family phosphatase [Acidobacteriaceae bacterium]|nr:HAD-IIIC family phosphatase [Acidobacteriaceae bacterium]